MDTLHCKDCYWDNCGSNRKHSYSLCNHPRSNEKDFWGYPIITCFVSRKLVEEEEKAYLLWGEKCNAAAEEQYKQEQKQGLQ